MRAVDVVKSVGGIGARCCVRARGTCTVFQLTVQKASQLDSEPHTAADVMPLLAVILEVDAALNLFHESYMSSVFIAGRGHDSMKHQPSESTP